MRGLQPGISTKDGWGLDMFTEDELYEIHLGTLDVLQSYGVKVFSDEALDIFADGGASVDRENNMVRVPPYLVEDAISSAPSTILLAGRDPKNDITLQGGRVGFTNFGCGTKVIDPYTGECRDSTLKDLGDVTLVCDAMEHIDIVMIAIEATDLYPDDSYYPRMSEVMLNNTSKHIISGGEPVFQMAAAIVGGKEKLRERPILTCGGCPNSPLELGEDLIYEIINGARWGVPVMVLSMAMSGGSAPVTLAGTLVTHNAEVLSGLVLHQLTAKGAPFLYSSSTTIMDMTYATAPVGSPELGMISAATTALARYYLLPSFIAGS